MDIFTTFAIFVLVAASLAALFRYFALPERD